MFRGCFVKVILKMDFLVIFSFVFVFVVDGKFEDEKVCGKVGDYCFLNIARYLVNFDKVAGE